MAADPKRAVQNLSAVAADGFRASVAMIQRAAESVTGGAESAIPMASIANRDENHHDLLNGNENRGGNRNEFTAAINGGVVGSDGGGGDGGDGNPPQATSTAHTRTRSGYVKLKSSMSASDAHLSPTASSTSSQTSLSRDTSFGNVTADLASMPASSPITLDGFNRNQQTVPPLRSNSHHHASTSSAGTAIHATTTTAAAAAIGSGGGRGGEVVWERDEDVKACRRCGTSFGWIVRRHHCRTCGRVC